MNQTILLEWYQTEFCQFSQVATELPLLFVRFEEMTKHM